MLTQGRYAPKRVHPPARPPPPELGDGGGALLVDGPLGPNGPPKWHPIRMIIMITMIMLKLLIMASLMRF